MLHEYRTQTAPLFSLNIVRRTGQGWPGHIELKCDYALGLDA